MVQGSSQTLPRGAPTNVYWQPTVLKRTMSCHIVLTGLNTCDPQVAFIPAKTRPSRYTAMTSLIQSSRRRHAGFDSQATNVLPSLLQQADQVVDGQHDVGDQLVLGHAHISDGDAHAENLLKLELDRGLHVGDLGVKVFRVRDRGGEFSRCA